MRTPASSPRFLVWTPNGLLLYAIDAATNAPSFYHYDRQGSTLALTDGSGTVTDKYAYSPYGELLAQEGPSTQPFRFLGAFGIRSEGTLCQVRARYYDPQTARFLSRDPAVPRLSDPRTLDPYLYALGNPLRYVDRDGADEEGYTNLGMWFAMTFVQTHFEEYSPEDDKLGPGGQPPEEKFVDTRVEAPVLDGPEVFVERPRKPEFEDFSEVEAQASLAQSLLGAPSESAGGKGEPGPASKWAQLVDEAIADHGLKPIPKQKPFILPPDMPNAIFLEAFFGVPESPSEATRRGLRIPADPPRQKSTSPTPSATTGVAPDAPAQQAQAVADNALRTPNKATNNELGPLNALKKFVQKAKNKAAVEKEKKKYGVDKVLPNNGFPLPKGK
jgi:RHS repeat-associated protein